MKYHLDLFTPETWEAFRKIGATVTGFRERHQRLAEERVSKGDIFLCYLTRLSRWCGVLEVESGPYLDDSPLLANPDPFTVRFNVKPIAVLDLEFAVPIRDPRLWSTLTITKQYDVRHPNWKGFFRGSLKTFEDIDGEFLSGLIKEQLVNPESYPLTGADRRQLPRSKTVRTLEREVVEVEVPDSEDEDYSLASEETVLAPEAGARESIRYQAKVAQIGAEMGFHIWVPRSDKARVLEFVPPRLRDKFLDEFPMQYDVLTMRTVEQIDVLWLKGLSMVRAFEIEHSTAVYSGLLRMADFLAPSAQHQHQSPYRSAA